MADSGGWWATFRNPQQITPGYHFMTLFISLDDKSKVGEKNEVKYCPALDRRGQMRQAETRRDNRLDLVALEVRSRTIQVPEGTRQCTARHLSCLVKALKSRTPHRGLFTGNLLLSTKDRKVPLPASFCQCTSLFQNHHHLPQKG